MKKKEIVKQPQDNELLHELDVEKGIDATMKRSRLQKTALSRFKHTIALLILGCIALGVFLFFFGPQLIINFSLLLGNFNAGGNEQAAAEKSNEDVFVPRPEIRTDVKATKESTITVEGSVLNGTTVELFVNDSLVGSEEVTDGKFTFRDVPLKEGENRIKAHAMEGDVTGDYSETLRVVYREKAPELEIETPKDGDAFSGGVSILKVKGTTTPYATVTINGSRSLVGEDGAFSRDYRMQSGENHLVIIAADEAGNKTEKEVRFTYSP